VSPPAQRDISNYSADDFAVHCSSKIEQIRTATASEPAIVIRYTAATPLSSLRPVNAAEIMRLLTRTPPKHCQLDPVSTWLVKRVAVILAPVVS